MHVRTEQQGVTLIELLITMAILSLILAGIYGMLNAANQTYVNTRALVENQQTSRQIINYLLFRLREIDGSGLVKDPRYCTDCHTMDIDNDAGNNDDGIPCPKDVRIPRRSLYIENLTTLPLVTLNGIDSTYQNLPGYNSITFWADLLPITGFPDEFTDSPSVGAYSSERDGVWRLIPARDEETPGIYDPGPDREVLYYDLNDNGLFDYYAEKWRYSLKKSADYDSFELIEELSFTHTTDKGGTLDVSSKNDSTFVPYTAPVAYGITGLSIKVIPRIAPNDYPAPADRKLMNRSCGEDIGSADIDTCHGNKVGDKGRPDWLNVYENETAFSYARFVTTHPWWNIKALALEVATVDPQGLKFMKMKQMLIPRNLEVNQEYYVAPF